MAINARELAPPDTLELSVLVQADAALSACTRRLDQLAPATPQGIRAELSYLKSEIEAARAVLINCYLSGTAIPAQEVEP